MYTHEHVVLDGKQWRLIQQVHEPATWVPGGCAAPTRETSSTGNIFLGQGLTSSPSVVHSFPSPITPTECSRALFVMLHSDEERASVPRTKHPPTYCTVLQNRRLLPDKNRNFINLDKSPARTARCGHLSLSLYHRPPKSRCHVSGLLFYKNCTRRQKSSNSQHVWCVRANSSCVAVPFTRHAPLRTCLLRESSSPPTPPTRSST